jgi:serine/threonine protein kinase
VLPGANIDEIYKRNKDIALDITPLHKYNVPKVAQDLILKLLEIDPQKRYSAAEALAHPFL